MTCDADASVRGCPCPGSRRWRQAKAGCRKRGRHRVNGGQDARSERPALGAGQTRTPADRVNYWMLPVVSSESGHSGRLGPVAGSSPNPSAMALASLPRLADSGGCNHRDSSLAIGWWRTARVPQIVYGRLLTPSTCRSAHGRCALRVSRATPPPAARRPRGVPPLRASPPREDAAPQDRLREPRELARVA